MSAPRATRLLTVPARHPYVDAVRPAEVRAVRPGRTVGWEPDPVLRPEVVADLAGEVDVVHVHFGFDDLDGATVRTWLRSLADSHLPLVFTAHDLRNPHHLARRRHDGVLGELVAAAAAVITLTPGAAAEIESRWGRTTHVIPHPSLVDPVRSDDVTTEPGLVVLHLKSLRRNVVEPVDLARAAAVGAAEAGGRLRVDLHGDAATGPLLAALARMPGVELVVHDRFTDLELERYLRMAHVTVLPYRWGTHSGWLELARDLGTRVVAPSCGYYAQQWAEVVTYGNDERHGLDPGSLAAAVRTALATPPPAPADPELRRAEIRLGRATHREIYSAVRAGRGSVVPS